MKFIKLLFIFSCVLVLTSCGDDEDEIFIPKPKGYFRIDFPKKEYRVYDSLCPYSFEIPTYAFINNDNNQQGTL